MDQLRAKPKYGCLGVIILVLIIGFLSEKFGCNNKTADDSKIVSEQLINDSSDNGSAAKIIKSLDPDEIKTVLLQIYLTVDANDNELIKLEDKYYRIVSNNANFFGKKYEIAKKTKEALTQAKATFISFKIPKEITDDSRNSLTESFSTIEKYYDDIIDGIDMDLSQNLRLFKNQLPFGGGKELQNLQEASDAIDDIAKVLIDNGFSAKEIKRMEKNEKASIK